MVADTTQVVKEVKRREPAKLDETELELQQTLEQTALAAPQALEAAKEQMLADQQAAKAGIFNVEDLARTLDIPPGFILSLGGKPYVTKEGLLVKARRIGFRAPDETRLLEAMVGHVDKDVFRETYRDLQKPTIAHATATKANVKMGTMHAYMRELAETRAINRALRLYTGCGLVSVDELPDQGASA